MACIRQRLLETQKWTYQCDVLSPVHANPAHPFASIKTGVLQLPFMAPVKAVLFDYGMVLSGPPDPTAWARMLSITGLSEELLHRQYWAHRHAYDRGDLNAESFWHTAASGAGIVLTPQQFADLVAADTEFWSTLNPPMLAWVQRLQRARIRTGILSNMGDAMEAGLRARHPWIETFDHHTWSHSLRLAKPEPAIYLHAAQGLNTPPADILFLDDRTENIEAALAIGMQAILYTTHQAFEQEMHARGLDHLLPAKQARVAQSSRRALAVLRAYPPTDDGEAILIETAIEQFEDLLRRAGGAP